MTDSERGLRNSISSAFPSATMDGCLFHFCQATLNWVRKNGLEKAYEKGERDPVIRRYNPSQVRVWVRRLQHLAFVPIDDVPSAFTSLCDEIPLEICLDDFIAYFSKHMGAKICRWTQCTLPSCVLERVGPKLIMSPKQIKQLP